jgi:hypothetical protein
MTLIAEPCSVFVNFVSFVVNIWFGNMPGFAERKRGPSKVKARAPLEEGLLQGGVAVWWLMLLLQPFETN